MRKLQEALDFFKGIALQQNIDLFFSVNQHPRKKSC